MVKVLIIDKACSLKCSQFKNFDIDNLYKKANLRKKDNFKLRHTWSVNKDNMFISIYSKDKGRANNENKYDFPPPVDNNLFFGNCVLFAKDSDNDYIDLSIELWNKIYEKLFGGFENLDATAQDDEDEEDELENIPAEMKTKEGGYLKDDFIVDDDDEPDEEAEDEDEDEEEESWDDNEENEENDEDDEDDDEMFDELGSELSVECYDYSDED